MQKRFKLCILHIGTEKTGSSSIQAFLHHNRKALLRQGFYYPEQGAAGSQWEFVALVHPITWELDIGKALNISDESSRQSFNADFLSKFAKQAEKVPNDSVLLISSEHFHSRLTSTVAIRQFKSLMEPFVENFKILVYLRRQDELAVSHFTTRVKTGSHKGGSVLHLPPPGAKAPFYEYDKLVARWADVFGLENVQGGLYQTASRGEHGILDDFCQKCGIDINGKYIPAWQNRSVSASGLRFIQSLNSLYKEEKSPISAADKDELIRLCSLQNEGKFYPISRADAQHFYERFIDVNERVREMLFPDHVGPLFNEDFSQYPEAAEKLPNTYNDAVMQAVKLWQQSSRRGRLQSIVKWGRDRIRR